MEIFYSDNINGSLVLLDQEESTHCVKVLRHKVGDTVNVIDGRGNLLVCTLVDANPKGATLSIEQRIADFGSHPYNLTIACCPTKNNDRFEWFAEKATEIGLDRIVPVIGDHSERKVYKTERLERIVLSATKQSLKGTLPEVGDVQSVKDFIKSCPQDALKLICYCFEAEKLSIKQALQSATDGQAIIILIGPEGDFSPAEVGLALESGFKSVHLGDSRLRTETAALTGTQAVYLHYMD